jgi:hypothetical protein
MRHLLVDTDTAADDPVALVMGLRHPGVRVEAITAYLSEEQQRQRVRELVRKKTGLDWPELKVGDIEKAMSSVTLFYWCTKEDVGKRWLQKQLELSDEEADSIGV